MSPSPLALICITLLSNELMEKSDIPAIITEEVYHFYPLVTGKEL